MTDADPLLELRRQLRDIKGMREARPGVFELRGKTFVQWQAGQHAELRKAGGSGFDRYPIDTPAGRRKLVDEAKRRASLADDD